MSGRSPEASARRARRKFFRAIDERLAFWQEHYRKMGDKGGDNMPDRARQFLCEELRQEFAQLHASYR